ncbi:Uu.00g111790.m01.CDS01 [Anthostomella pinea]|uniref:Uu.00g111790.m01.CDS01 n=1 Tax=Anthostomella pinea TaxID=933095 RepID=A0AAI8VFP1_9PEZI|nr:Uu.00g111790.m01.CDS01 [Anthostomella pinea]
MAPPAYKQRDEVPRISDGTRSPPSNAQHHHHLFCAYSAREEINKMVTIRAGERQKSAYSMRPVRKSEDQIMEHIRLAQETSSPSAPIYWHSVSGRTPSVTLRQKRAAPGRPHLQAYPQCHPGCARGITAWTQRNSNDPIELYAQMADLMGGRGFREDDRDGRNNFRCRGEGGEDSDGWSIVKPRKSFGHEGAERFSGRMGDRPDRFGRETPSWQPVTPGMNRVGNP